MKDHKSIYELLQEVIMHSEDALWTIGKIEKHVDFGRLNKQERDDLQKTKEMIQSGRDLGLDVNKSFCKRPKERGNEK